MFYNSAFKCQGPLFWILQVEFEAQAFSAALCWFPLAASTCELGSFPLRSQSQRKQGSFLLRTLVQCQQVRLLALKSFHFLPLACFRNFLSENSKWVVFYELCPWSDLYILRISLSSCLQFLYSVTESACRWGSLCHLFHKLLCYIPGALEFVS